MAFGLCPWLVEVAQAVVRDEHDCPAPLCGPPVEDLQLLEEFGIPLHVPFGYRPGALRCEEVEEPLPEPRTLPRGQGLGGLADLLGQYQVDDRLLGDEQVPAEEA